MGRCFLTMCVMSALAWGQPRKSDQLADLRREIESLEQGQKKIEKDLSAVVDLLSGKKPLLEDVFVGIAGSPSLGSMDAKATIVEFTDFQCPFCAGYARETFPRIVRDYVDTGKVRYVIRNFPLEQVHPLARKAAEVSLCAEEQGKFWALHDRFFADQKKLMTSDVPEDLAAIGADPVAFQECLEKGQSAAKIGADLAAGHELEVAGTPTFFVGYSDSKDRSRIRAVRSIVGNTPYREFAKAIAEALEASNESAGERK